MILSVGEKECLSLTIDHNYQGITLTVEISLSSVLNNLTAKAKKTLALAEDNAESAHSRVHAQHAWLYNSEKWKLEESENIK